MILIPTRFLFRRHYFFALTLFLSLGILGFYRKSFNSYFEGDEWIYFRTFAPLLQSKLWFISGFLQAFKAYSVYNPHIAPVSDMFFVIEFKLFQLHFEKYLLVSLTLHIIISVLVAKLAFQVSGSKLLSSFSCIFFAFNAIHSEAVTWIMATLSTQLAVLFGLLSIIFVNRSFMVSKNKNYIFLAYLSLLFSLWSKETALTFPIMNLILIWRNRNDEKFWFHIKLLIFVALLFIGTELVGRRQYLNFPQLKPSELPWSYSIINLGRKIDVTEVLFYTSTTFLKMLSQSIIPSSTIRQWSIFLTDLQFPFFNQEKSVGGTTYVNFIQGPIPELLSYLSGTMIFFLFFLKNPFLKSKTYRFGLLIWLIGLLPILTILIGFSWLKYSPYISSRHFYHVTPGIALIFGYVLWRIQKKKGTLISLTLLLAFFSFQYITQSQQTTERQFASDFNARKNIIQTLASSFDLPPKKMIVYTTSNRNYYGFGLFMLPFPTAFSHMLPIIFSDLYNPKGLNYPPSFYDEKYLAESTDGLATQGYFQDGEYGLGYFLEKIKLIKTIEKEKIDVNQIYAFRFNGDDNSFISINEELRSELSTFLEKRQIFSSWRTFNYPEDFFLIQLDPTWKIEKQNNVYLISDQLGQPIVTIKIFKDMDKRIFSDFVTEQIVDGKKINKNYGTKTIFPDLGIYRLVYYPEWNQKVFFAAAGRGTTFYRFDITDVEKTDLMLRTIEFED